MVASERVQSGASLRVEMHTAASCCVFHDRLAH